MTNSSTEQGSNATDEATPSRHAAYRDLFLRSLDSILLVDIAKGTIIEANDAAAKLFRTDLEKLQGKSIYDYPKTNVRADFEKMIRVATRRYHPKLFEVPLIFRDESGHAIERITEMSASPLMLHDSTEVLQLIFRDITEKKQFIEELEAANKKLEELATTDGMTGLINFRHFSKLLETEHTRASRYRSKYAIVFMDVDHFKHYNDNNGHPAGDALLKQFAAIIKVCARTTDFPARYGGEEFVVLCPETDVGQAMVLAERIQKTVSSTSFLNAKSQPLGFVSCSLGVSAFPQDGNTTTEVLKAADERLYVSKEQGRNRITSC